MNERKNGDINLSQEEISQIWEQYDKVEQKMAEIEAKYGRGNAK